MKALPAIQSAIVVAAIQVTAFVPLARAAPTAEQLNFFESKIRPVLAEKCFKCHSVDSEKLKGGLHLDSLASVLRGGDTGAAIEPGDADASLMIESLRYGDPDFQMPPKGKLADEVIADFEKWVTMGAPWPNEAEPVRADGAAAVEVFDLDQRKTEHWSWQAIEKPTPPAVANGDWINDPLDVFILAGLEAADLRPADDAAPATWLRRVYFDLIGLPPTADELEKFESDLAAAIGVLSSSPKTPRTPAVEKVFQNTVDKLLASPHFGERWARHWMDLARYGETCGHEFDYPIPHARKYRDYLVRAFNADLPYDQFVLEHVAGDQVDEPRRHPDTATNESIVGTGFWFLHESVHAPTDVRLWEADHIDNRIDALSRGFLGLTVSCARCHDHKFDAIPTTDYYALAGYLQSSRRSLTPLDPGGEIARASESLNGLHQQADEILGDLKAPGPPSSIGGEDLREGDTSLADFIENPADIGWSSEGQAFDLSLAHCLGGEWLPEDPGMPIASPGLIHSGRLAARAEGALRSPTFELTEPFIHLRLKTGDGAGNLIVRLIIDGYDMNLFHTLLFKGTILKDKNLDTSGEFRWLTMAGNLDKYVGHRVYLEVIDQGDNWIVLDEIVLSSDKKAPSAGSEIAIAKLPVELTELAEKYRQQAKSFPKPDYAIAMIDGTPEDEYVFIRGSHKSRGELVPRRFLAALGGERQTAPADSSGRLELAQQMLADDNPLTARVLVNRLWHHLFGRGIVPTVDDFGVMGQPPSNPELLDHLASEFRSTQQWSIKQALRSIVLSRTYRMGSTAHSDNDPDRLAEIDPDNILLHRAPVRRLQAEAIRDAILAVAGSLDRTLGGGSVPVHLTSFMEGRGRPRKSGPLDGDGRRSLYLEVRRNFLSPMMLAFDMPSPFSAMGRRSLSNVPSQSLVLMNDPFVVEQAAQWAESLTGDGDRRSDRDRLSLAFRQAFSREPEAHESERLLTFLEAADDRAAAWRDLCHVLFNKKELIYLN